MSTLISVITPLLLQQSTQRKDLSVNELVIILAAYAQVRSYTTTTPPASPATGDAYIPAATATGAWAGHEDQIAYWFDGAWRFLQPVSGVIVGVADSVDYVEYLDESPGGWVVLAIGTGVSRAPNVQAVTSASTVTPSFSDDLVDITAQAVALTLANPSGSPIEGIGIAIRIEDNGTARTIAYGSQYRAIGVTLPTTTVAGKVLYLGCIWRSVDSKLDVVAVAQEA